jgi:hypothetical protein
MAEEELLPLGALGLGWRALCGPDDPPPAGVPADLAPRLRYLHSVQRWTALRAMDAAARARFEYALPFVRRGQPVAEVVPVRRVCFDYTPLPAGAGQPAATR